MLNIINVRKINAIQTYAYTLQRPCNFRSRQLSALLIHTPTLIAWSVTLDLYKAPIDSALWYVDVPQSTCQGLLMHSLAKRKAITYNDKQIITYDCNFSLKLCANQKSLQVEPLA